jgi:hypothetical protein
MQSKNCIHYHITNNKFFVRCYPNCNAIIHQFLTEKYTVKDSEKRKQEGFVETLRLQYEAIEDRKIFKKMR